MAKLKLRGKSRTIVDDDATEESLRRSSIRNSDEISVVNDPFWSRLLEEEDRDVTALALGEEVFNRCAEIIYAKYIKKQSIYFTVHCAYLAWIKIINLYFLKHDPGEPEQDNFSLRPDKEPTPNPKDSWCARSVTVEYPPKKVCSLVSNLDSHGFTTPPETVTHGMAKARDESDGADSAESEEVRKPDGSDVSEDIIRGSLQVPLSQRKKATTAKIRHSMVSDSGRPPPPPPPTPSGLVFRHSSTTESKVKEALLPTFLSRDLFPSERADVKYSVVPLDSKNKADKKDSEEEIPREGRVRWSDNVK